MFQNLFGGPQKFSHFKWWGSELPTWRIADLDQWFSTFGSWRPTKQYKIQSSDPFSNEMTGFGDPK